MRQLDEYSDLDEGALNNRLGGTIQESLYDDVLLIRYVGDDLFLDQHDIIDTRMWRFEVLNHAVVVQRKHLMMSMVVP
jgi:hypothetical protein